MVELPLTHIRCPACNEDQARPGYDKQGFSIVQCRRCTLRYVNPRPSRTWLDAWYQWAYFSPSHDNAAGAQHLLHEAVKTATARLRLQLLSPAGPKGRLLDIGCGGGFFVRAAAAVGWDAMGLEPSVEAARHAARTQHIRVVAGRSEETPFVDDRFDVITLFDVLEHVFCPRTCLTEARRLLAPDGKLVIETPNMAGWLPRVMGTRHPWIRPPEHLTYFTPPTLRLLLAQCGLRVEQLHGRTTKVLTLEYVLALLTQTNPLLTTLLRGTIGRWKPLSRYPFSVPLDTMLAVASPSQERSA
ncbi:MAG: class I SAM-dependent methyltransferase [Nitrospirota bacterium]|nr:class I SAM-dependent methyltransferase [Nitrospirota bacterium]